MRLVYLVAAGALLLPSHPATTEFHGPPGSGKPNLATTANGQVVLTWLEPVDSARHALRFSVRGPTGWSLPGTIRTSDRFFVNWADFPSLAISDNLWVAHWLEKTAARPYAYHVMLATSRDAGVTWSTPVRAHADTSSTEHGFVTMVPHPGGGVDLIWLDGQKMQSEERGEMAVRVNRVDGQGQLGREHELDGRTCECCQAALARTSRGLVAAWRDRSQGEVRDIAVAIEREGRWSAPVTPAPDAWVHRACPVNGPALAAQGDQVDLVWYTGANDEPAVWLIRSSDGGETFGPRVRIAERGTLGRVHAVPDGEGGVLVAWLDPLGQEEAVWRVRRVARDGAPGAPRDVARVTRARLAGFPRLARSGADVYFAYTASGVNGGVRVTRLDAGTLAPK